MAGTLTWMRNTSPWQYVNNFISSHERTTGNINGANLVSYCFCKFGNVYFGFMLSQVDGS